MSVAYGVFIALRTIVLGVDVPGWATLTVALCFIGGLQLLFLGIIGQYVRAVFIESKQRPNYLVQKTSESGLCSSLRPAASEPEAERLERSRVSNGGRQVEAAINAA
jgi:hypothetical protein